MSRRFTIFVGEASWAVASVSEGQVSWRSVTGEEPANVPSLAHAVREVLGQMEYEGDPVMLALASSWCLCAEISTEDLERGNRRKALAFRLEEHLPISAEDIVADYIEIDRGRSLGVCIQTQVVSDVIEALAAVSVAVRHICPAALLSAAWAHQQDGQIHAVLDRRGNGVANSDTGFDLIEMHRGRPTQWWWFAEDGKAMVSHLASLSEQHEPAARLATVGRDERLSSVDNLPERLQWVRLDKVSDDEAAALFGAQILEGTSVPWIDLRRDQLAAPEHFETYRKPVMALLIAVLVLIASVLVATQWRGRKYEAMSERYLAQQKQVYEEVLPDQPLRSSVRRQLQLEQRKLAGLGGQAGTDEQSASSMRPISALVQLHDVLSVLPKDLRYRILDLSIEPELVRVDGEARTHAEAEKLALSLRAGDRYTVEAPKTQALREQGVSFVFSAKRQAPAKEAPKP